MVVGAGRGPLVRASLQVPSSASYLFVDWILHAADNFNLSIPSVHI